MKLFFCKQFEDLKLVKKLIAAKKLGACKRCLRHLRRKMNIKLPTSAETETAGKGGPLTTISSSVVKEDSENVR